MLFINNDIIFLSEIVLSINTTLFDEKVGISCCSTIGQISWKTCYIDDNNKEFAIKLFCLRENFSLF